MQYVPFGDLGFNISRLGFGMMRLPKVTLPDGSTALDEARRWWAASSRTATASA